MDCRTYVNCCKCVPSVLVTINCANKMFTFQNRKRVRIIKITPGGASGAILENYENMLTSPKLNLSEGNLFYKTCSKWNDCIVCTNICEV